jgi:hypothetical protein
MRKASREEIWLNGNIEKKIWCGISGLEGGGRKKCVPRNGRQL